MPRINKYSIVGFVYGTETDRVLSDRVIELDGDHLQMEASNTVGKSMSIQTIIQAICPLSDVAKPFVEVYTKREPVYALIEWLLDDGKTTLLTGVGFERKSISSEEGASRVEKMYSSVAFTIEKDSMIGMDINNFQLMEDDGTGNKRIKSVLEIERYVKDLQTRFGRGIISSYRCSYHQGRKEYGKKLREYGIYQEEWKDVIIKLNSENKEGGLSEFVETYNTTQKLMVGSILPLVENNLIRDYDDIVEKPITVLREQVSKCIDSAINMKEGLDNYERYKKLYSKVENLQLNLKAILTADVEYSSIKDELANLCACLENEKAQLIEENIKYTEISKELVQKEKDIEFEKMSFKYNEIEKKIEELNKTVGALEVQEKQQNEIIGNAIRDGLVLKYQSKQKSHDREKETFDRLAAEREKKSLEIDKISQMMTELGSSIKYALDNIKLDILGHQEKNESDITTILKKIENSKKAEGNLNRRLAEITATYNAHDKIKREFDRKVNKFKEENLENEKTLAYITSDMLGTTIDFEGYQKYIVKTIDGYKEAIAKAKDELSKNEQLIEKCTSETDTKKSEKNKLQVVLGALEGRKEEIIILEEAFSKVKDRFDLSADLADNEDVCSKISNRVTTYEAEIADMGATIKEFSEEIFNLDNFKTVSIDDDLIDELNEMGIVPVKGVEYISKQPGDMEYKLEMLRKNPLLPYSIILTEKEFEKLCKQGISNRLTAIVPIFVRNSLELSEELHMSEESKNIYASNMCTLVAAFDTKVLNIEYVTQKIQNLKEKISSMKQRISEKNTDIEMLNVFKNKYLAFEYKLSDANISTEIAKVQNDINQMDMEIQATV
ncbi:MAG: hypothetical protein ACRC30_07925, partial [Clostridium sp.]